MQVIEGSADEEIVASHRFMKKVLDWLELEDVPKKSLEAAKHDWQAR